MITWDEAKNNLIWKRWCGLDENEAVWRAWVAR